MPVIYLVQVKFTPDPSKGCNDGHTEADARTEVIGYYTNVEDAIRCARSEAKTTYENAFEYTKPKESPGDELYNVEVSFFFFNYPGLQRITFTVDEVFLHESYRRSDKDQDLDDLKERPRMEEVKPADFQVLQWDSQASNSAMFLADLQNEVAPAAAKGGKKSKRGRLSRWFGIEPWDRHGLDDTSG